MLALVGIRSNVMCISYNKSIMAELCSRCPVEQKHGRAVCVSGQTRPCVCVCVYTASNTGCCSIVALLCSFQLGCVTERQWITYTRGQWVSG